MTDHGSVEKTGALPRPLSTAGVPGGADPAVGDIGYYALGNDFVMYYGDQSYYEGIVRLGTLDGDLDLLEQSDDLRVTLEGSAEDQLHLPCRSAPLPPRQLRPQP